MSVFEWIKVHEGFFSGLVAIIAILGIAGAGTRLLWIRLRVLGPGVIKRRAWWMMAGGGLVAISLVMYPHLPWQTCPDWHTLM